MANLQIPHIFSGGSTFEPQEVNTNNAAIAAKFGALTTQDLAASANIANSQLANDDYEFTIEGTPEIVSGADITDYVYAIGILPFEEDDTYNLISISYTSMHPAGAVVAGQYVFGYQIGSATSATTVETSSYTPIASTWITTFTAVTVAIADPSVGSAVTLIMSPGTGYPTDATGTQTIPAKVTFKFKRSGGLR